MGVVENVRDVADIVKKFGDIDLNRRILKLEEEVLDLTREKRRIENKNEELEHELKIKGLLIFRENQYYLREGEHEDGPFCSLCWDRDKRLIRKHDTAYGISCPACVQDRITSKHK